MTQTFTINQSLIGNLLNRLVMRMVKTYAVVMIVVLIPNVLGQHRKTLPIVVATCFTVVFLAFPVIVGYKKARKTYSSLKIILDDTCIEYKSPMAPYKKIEWSEASFTEKESGDIKVYNNTVGSISLWWTGTGVILIPREINDKEQLLQLLYKYTNR